MQVGETFGNVVRASAETLDVAVETISSTAVIPTFAIDKDVALDDIKTFDGFCEQLGGWVDMLSTKDRKVVWQVLAGSCQERGAGSRCSDSCAVPVRQVHRHE